MSEQGFSYLRNGLATKDKLRLNTVAIRDAETEEEMVQHYKNRIKILVEEDRVEEAHKVQVELNDLLAELAEVHPEADPATEAPKPRPTKKTRRSAYGYESTVNLRITGDQRRALTTQAAAWGYDTIEEYIEVNLHHILGKVVDR